MMIIIMIMMVHKLSWIRAAELVKIRIIVAQGLETEF